LKLRRDLDTSLKEAKQSAEMANLVNFQNQLLIDMVSVLQHQLRNTSGFKMIPSIDYREG